MNSKALGKNHYLDLWALNSKHELRNVCVSLMK